MKRNLFYCLSMLLLNCNWLVAQNTICNNFLSNEPSLSFNNTTCIMTLGWQWANCTVSGTFYIQYSTTGNTADFITVGSVPVSGTANVSKPYSFQDPNACPGNGGNFALYRILYVDINGQLRKSSLDQPYNWGSNPCTCSGSDNITRCPGGLVSNSGATVSGANTICNNSSQSYIVTGTSGSNVISWTLSAPSGSSASYTTSSSFPTYNNSATITQGSTTGGNLTLTAYLIPLSTCTAPATLPFTVHPDAPGSIQYVDVAYQMTHCLVRWYKFTVVGADGATNYKWYYKNVTQGATSYTLYKNSSSNWANSPLNTSTCDALDIMVEASNSCGTTTYTFGADDCTPYFAPDCEYPPSPRYMLTASPNPSKSDIQLSVIDTTKESKKPEPFQIQQIKVVDKKGNIKKLIKGTNLSKMSISIAELPSDIYTIMVFNGKEWIITRVMKL